MEKLKKMEKLKSNMSTYLERTDTAIDTFIKDCLSLYDDNDITIDIILNILNTAKEMRNVYNDTTLTCLSLDIDLQIQSDLLNRLRKKSL